MIPKGIAFTTPHVNYFTFWFFKYDHGFLVAGALGPQFTLKEKKIGRTEPPWPSSAPSMRGPSAHALRPPNHPSKVNTLGLGLWGGTGGGGVHGLGVNGNPWESFYEEKFAFVFQVGIPPKFIKPGDITAYWLGRTSSVKRAKQVLCGLIGVISTVCGEGGGGGVGCGKTGRTGLLSCLFGPLCEDRGTPGVLERRYYGTLQWHISGPSGLRGLSPPSSLG